MSFAAPACSLARSQLSFSLSLIVFLQKDLNYFASSARWNFLFERFEEDVCFCGRLKLLCRGFPLIINTLCCALNKVRPFNLIMKQQPRLQAPLRPVYLTSSGCAQPLALLSSAAASLLSRTFRSSLSLSRSLRALLLILRRRCVRRISCSRLFRMGITIKCRRAKTDRRLRNRTGVKCAGDLTPWCRERARKMSSCNLSRFRLERS